MQQTICFMHQCIIMRMDHFILWIDDENDKVHALQLRELKNENEVNVYYEKSIQKASDFLHLKKYNKLKLIISVTDLKSADDLTEKGQNFYSSNIICLVYTKKRDFTWFTIEKENVFYTDDFNDVRSFAEMKLDGELLIQFKLFEVLC